jgi:predicted site-specific integrase-resolvase
MDGHNQPALFIFAHGPELTVREYAAIERVTERTVYSWISKGAVDIRRTPGGRIRIAGIMKTVEDSGSSAR